MMKLNEKTKIRLQQLAGIKTNRLKSVVFQKPQSEIKFKELYNPNQPPQSVKKAPLNKVTPVHKSSEDLISHSIKVLNTIEEKKKIKLTEADTDNKEENPTEEPISNINTDTDSEKEKTKDKTELPPPPDTQEFPTDIEMEKVAKALDKLIKFLYLETNTKEKIKTLAEKSLEEIKNFKFNYLSLLLLAIREIKSLSPEIYEIATKKFEEIKEYVISFLNSIINPEESDQETPAPEKISPPEAKGEKEKTTPPPSSSEISTTPKSSEVSFEIPPETLAPKHAEEIET